jgi:hypothetical protein
VQPEATSDLAQPGVESNLAQPREEAKTTQPGEEAKSTQPMVEANPAYPGVEANLAQPSAKVNPVPPGTAVNPSQPGAQREVMGKVRSRPAPRWCPSGISKTQRCRLQKMKQREIAEKQMEKERDAWFVQALPMTKLKKTWKENTWLKKRMEWTAVKAMMSLRPVRIVA